MYGFRILSRRHLKAIRDTRTTLDSSWAHKSTLSPITAPPPPSQPAPNKRFRVAPWLAPLLPVHTTATAAFYLIKLLTTTIYDIKTTFTAYKWFSATHYTRSYLIGCLLFFVVVVLLLLLFLLLLFFHRLLCASSSVVRTRHAHALRPSDLHPSTVGGWSRDNNNYVRARRSCRRRHARSAAVLNKYTVSANAVRLRDESSFLCFRRWRRRETIMLRVHVVSRVRAARNVPPSCVCQRRRVRVQYKSHGNLACYFSPGNNNRHRHHIIIIVIIVITIRFTIDRRDTPLCVCTRGCTVLTTYAAVTRCRLGNISRTCTNKVTRLDVTSCTTTTW